MSQQKKVYSYKEAFEKSKKYFKGEEFSARVFVDKYALRDREGNIFESSPVEMFERISSEIYRIEKNKFKKPLSYEEIYEYLKDFKKIVPQGSVLFGVGNLYQYVSLSNCFTIESPYDSYPGICKTDQEIVSISKRRGGVGFDISNLRPNGFSTTNAARTSTGIVPFMERFSNTIREVGQGGRRGACIMTLSVHHPEILHFAKVKNNLTKVTGANISIRLTDEFLKAVKENKEYEQRWPVEKEKKTVFSQMVNAKEVWMEIIKNAWAVADPGLLFWDNILRESIPDCYSEFGFKTVSVNPCSELILSAYDSCRLLILNLYDYVSKPFTKDSYFNFSSFYNDAQVAQRFMDDIVDLEIECVDKIIKKIKRDPEPIEIKKSELDMWKKIKNFAIKGRRTGTGITALGDTFAALGIKYGSEESIKITDKIYNTLKMGCYKSSVDMAKELGSFPIWDHQKEKNNPFLLRIKKENENLWKEMKKYGRRNIALLTTSPTGSISHLTQTTSGIEPLYNMTYKRRKKINPSDKDVRVDFVDKNGDCFQEFDIYHPKIKDWMEVTGENDISKSPWYNCCAEDIDWGNRVRLQAVANKNVCHGISSTVNLTESVSVEQVAEVYETAWKEGVKGITVFRKNCRPGILLDNTLKIKKTQAPKRPKILPCDIFSTIVKGETYFVIIGLLEGKEPYEIFAGKGEQINKSLKKAFIKKVKRGTYAILDVKTKEIIHPNINNFIDEDQEAITRLVSSNLRHGCDVNFVVHQLEKTRGDLQSFSKAISRILKKYIVENSLVYGEECPKCGGKLYRSEGCFSCSCGWSKCN